LGRFIAVACSVARGSLICPCALLAPCSFVIFTLYWKVGKDFSQTNITNIAGALTAAGNQTC
jgi:hypothetical protein